MADGSVILGEIAGDRGFGSASPYGPAEIGEEDALAQLRSGNVDELGVSFSGRKLLTQHI